MSLSTWCLGRCAPLSCTDRSSFTGSHLSVSWKSIAEDAECLMRGDTGSRATHCVPKPCFIKVCPASWWMAEWVSYWETSVLLCVCAHISMSWFTAIRVILNQNICERFRSALRRGAWGERYYSENAVRKQIRHKLTSMQCSKHLVGKSAAYSKLQYRTELRCCFGLKRSCFIQDVSSRCIKHTRFSLVFAVSQTAHWEMSRARGSSNFYQLKISPPPCTKICQSWPFTSSETSVSPVLPPGPLCQEEHEGQCAATFTRISITEWGALGYCHCE